MLGSQDLVGMFDVVPTQFISLGLGVEQLVKNNPRRVALIFGNGVGSGPFWPNADVVSGVGIPLPAGGMLSFTFREYGSLVTGEWWWPGGAGTSVAIIEVIFSPRR